MRTGSADDRIITALVNRIREVRDAAAAMTTAGEDAAKSGRWCSPTPYTSSPTWSASTISSTTSRSRSAWLIVSPVITSGVVSTKVLIPSSTTLFPQAVVNSITIFYIFIVEYSKLKFRTHSLRKYPTFSSATQKADRTVTWVTAQSASSMRISLLLLFISGYFRSQLLSPIKD
ncbi:hypothetical protein D3C74_359500 [compost metagenome]